MADNEEVMEREIEVQKIEPRVDNLYNMSPDDIEKAIAGDWKAHDGTTAESVAKKNNVTIAKIKNLRQYSDKPVSVETKMAVLKGLSNTPSGNSDSTNLNFPDTVRNPKLLMNILTVDEQQYFIDRWTEYYAIYGEDLNTGPDYDNMLELVMCYIDLYRIQKKKKNSVSLQTDVGIDKVQHNIHTRIQNLLSTLKTRRKDRVESNERKETKLFDLLIAKTKDPGSFFKLAESKLSGDAVDELRQIEEKRLRIEENV